VSSSLERLKQTHPVDVVWRSYELRPAGSPPIPEAYMERIRQTRPQFETMAREQYGLEINSGPFGIESRTALIASKFAERHHKGNEFHDSVFRAYWQQGLDISEPTVLTNLAESVNLSAVKMATALHDQHLIKLVDHDIQQAQQLNISGVPALIFAAKYYIPGAQPYEELVRIVDYVRRRESEK